VAITGAAGTTMTSPVLDNASGYLFLGSSNGTAYAVLASAPATQSTMTVGCGTCPTGVAGKGAIFDGPVVDSTNKTVFFSASANAAGVGDTTVDLVAVVVQATTTPTLFGSKTVAVLGEGMGGSANANVNYVHAGTFDQAYFNWTGTGNNGGHYFACGTPTAARSPVFYAIPFATGAAGATISPGTYTNGSRAPSGNLIGSTTPLLTGLHEDCTPMSEIYNGTNDFIFFGLGTVNTTGTGPDGEVAEYTGTGTGGSFTNAIIQGAPTNTIAEPPAQGGTSAIAVDNISTQAQAASIYFATLATSNNCGTGTFCAVKVTQAALQ